jgi:hypothetical protein
MPDMPVAYPRPLDTPAAARLRRLNLAAGDCAAYACPDVSLPVTAPFLAAPPGTGSYDSASLGSLRIDLLVAAFLPLTAMDHVTLSAGRPRR